MEKDTLFIRADATSTIGAGHIMRCLALAQAWKDRGGAVTFITHCTNEALTDRIRNEGFNLISLDRSCPDPEDLRKTLAAFGQESQPDRRLVLDGYHFTEDYQASLCDAGVRLLVMDDLNHLSHYHAEILVNPSPSANRLPYQVDEQTTCLLGNRYVLLRREFLSKDRTLRGEPPGIAGKVLITLGGGDSDNVTLKAIESLKQIALSGLEARIIAGPLNSFLPELEKAVCNHPAIQVIKDAPNMPDLMAWADLAIISGGGTCWEAAFMGLPALILMTADNQQANAEAASRAGSATCLGWGKNLTIQSLATSIRQLMQDRTMRTDMSGKGRQLIDGRGCERIVALMTHPALILRPMHAEDCERVWRWSNDPSVREVSFSEAPIAWGDHVIWFEKRIAHPHFYLALNDADLPVGQVRFDNREGQTTISVMIDKDFRDCGYGSALIRIACERIFSEGDIHRIHAFIKPGNDASQHAFQKAGFRRVLASDIGGGSADHLVLSKTG